MESFARALQANATLPTALLHDLPYSPTPSDTLTIILQ